MSLTESRRKLKTQKNNDSLAPPPLIKGTTLSNESYYTFSAFKLLIYHV